MKIKFDRTRIAYCTLASAVVALFLFFSYAGVFDEFEYSTLDFRYKGRPPLKVNYDIVIIEVGDDSIEKIGKWPFPRKYHALITRALKAAGAKTIIFDMFFSEPKEGDEGFARAIEDAGNVYIPYVFEIDRSGRRDRSRIHATEYAAEIIAPFKDAVKGSGFINAEPDVDGKIRRIPAFIEYEGKIYPHLTLLVALNNKGYGFEQAEIVPGKYIRAGDDVLIPLESDSSIMVNYPGRWGKAFRHYSYVDILQSYMAELTGQKPSIDLKELENAVCFIGVTATASPDAHPSPMERLYAGVGVHASVYNSIFRKMYITRTGRAGNMAILAFMCVLTGVLTYRTRKRFAVLSVVLLVFLFFLASLVLFWPFGIWIDVFYPLVAMGFTYIIVTFIKYLNETRQREIIEKELDIAKDIQQSFLPKDLPEVGGLEVAVKMITARQVGGDLYDVIKLDDGRLGVMIGDVSGKGVPAALYMSRVVSVFKTFISAGDAAEVLTKVNESLAKDNTSGLFVTMTYKVFDTSAWKSEFAIGGHMPTMMVKPDGTVSFLDVSEGMPLGMIDWSGYSRGEVDYTPGTLFVLYSDGVTEAMDVNGGMFGEGRLKELGVLLAGRGAGEAVETIQNAVAAFAGKAKQHDDITVMAIKT